MRGEKRIMVNLNRKNMLLILWEDNAERYNDTISAMTDEELLEEGIKRGYQSIKRDD